MFRANVSRGHEGDTEAPPPPPPRRLLVPFRRNRGRFFLPRTSPFAAEPGSKCLLAPTPLPLPTFQCETRARIGFEDESYRFYTRTPLFIARMFEGRVIKSSRGERAVFAVMRGILFSWKWSRGYGDWNVKVAWLLFNFWKGLILACFFRGGILAE